MVKKIAEFLCRVLGHDVEPIDVAIYLLEKNAIVINGPQLNPELRCQRCGRLLADKKGKCQA